MQVVGYNEKYLSSLTRLINQQIAAVPPGWTVSEEQVAATIARGGLLWNLHYPDERLVITSETLCVLERHEVVAAAQWSYPHEDKPVFSIPWLVAQPGRPLPIRTLLHMIDRQVEQHGSGKVDFSRFAFGAGWFGIPAVWKHIIDAVVEAGYKQTDRWVIMYGDTDIYPAIPPPKAQNLRYYWNMNKPALEWDVTAYDGEALAGTCQVWGIPPHLEGCPGFAEWAALEWLEVESAFRRQGVGRGLIAEQMRFQSRRGIHHFMIWVKHKNKAARKLNESIGFVYGPELVLMQKA